MSFTFFSIYNVFKYISFFKYFLQQILLKFDFSGVSSKKYFKILKDFFTNLFKTSLGFLRPTGKFVVL